jgi:hypothetical protein
MNPEAIVNLVPWMLAFLLAFFFFVSWQRERREDRHTRQYELQRQQQREEEAAMLRKHEREEAAKLREQEKEEASLERYIREKREDEEKLRTKAGAGSGGYIVLDLPDAHRGLFHDLLKGFEDYARLKGYGVSFSVDTTFHDRIAFKFTLTDPDVVVGNDRVRKDLSEYLQRVSSGGSLDDLPQVISIEEHELLVTTLKNRINFLQHNYNLAKNSMEFYERLVQKVGAQSFLPAPSVIVQTGGSYSAPSYSALNSPQSVLGIENVARNTIRIAVTYKERKEQIDCLTDLLDRLASEVVEPERDEAIRNLTNVKEELEHTDQPDTGRVTSWLERAKQAIQLGSLGYETAQAAKELFKLFGLG